MRTAFIDALTAAARSHPNIFLVVGDLGFSVVEPFAEEFPDRFLNAGVAEQNMTGVAAGLASEGYHVFTYSIANFPTLRCLEQIRNDVCYHNLPVTVVAVGGGMAYGNLGYSHHAVQDIGIMRTLPSITVLSPADPGEARACVNYLVDHPGPSYLRIGKAAEKVLYQAGPLQKKPVVVRAGGSRVAIVATGSVLSVALAAAEHEELAGRTPPTVISMPWLHPCDAETVANLNGYSKIICVQEHIKEGGLGDILRGGLPSPCQVQEFAVPSAVSHTVGSQAYLRDAAGLTASKLSAAAALISE